MKKGTLLFLVLTCMLAGCGQKEAGQGITPTQETVAVEQETEEGVFRYEASAGTECFAVDEEGMLYTIAKNNIRKRISVLSRTL